MPADLRSATLASAPAGGRALAPAARYRLDTRLFLDAERAIPRDATYAVVTGGGVPSRRVRAAERALLAYWLLPRRVVAARSGAWIVSIGGDLRSLGLRYARVIHVGPGRELAEVRR